MRGLPLSFSVSHRPRLQRNPEHSKILGRNPSVLSHRIASRIEGPSLKAESRRKAAMLGWPQTHRSGIYTCHILNARHTPQNRHQLSPQKLGGFVPVIPQRKVWDRQDPLCLNPRVLIKQCREAPGQQGHARKNQESQGYFPCHHDRTQARSRVGYGPAGAGQSGSWTHRLPTSRQSEQNSDKSLRSPERIAKPAPGIRPIRSAGSGSTAKLRRKGFAHAANAAPVAPPIPATSRPSPMTCPNNCQGPAPSASRMAISWRRSSMRAIKRCARFAQAISNTSPTAPQANSNDGRTLLVIAPANGITYAPMVPFVSGKARADWRAIPWISASACSTVTPDFKRAITSSG